MAAFLASIPGLADKSTVSKSWVQRIRVAGRVTNIGLGAYPMLKLADARRKALKNRRNIAQDLVTTPPTVPE